MYIYYVWPHIFPSPENRRYISIPSNIQIGKKQKGPVNGLITHNTMLENSIPFVHRRTRYKSLQISQGHVDVDAKRLQQLAHHTK